MPDIPEQFDPASVLAGLTSFQRATVEHVTRRFYGPEPTRRFLVADETGLGKSMIARGVIAHTVTHLQHDPAVDRIDIVYICSNAEIAEQNLRRLDVLGERQHRLASRLTLLPKELGRLTARSSGAGKPVNLIAFTPGTSFDTGGWQTGLAEERAMLFLLLEDTLADGYARRAALRLLQGPVRTMESFESTVDKLTAAMGEDGPPRQVTRDFLRATRAAGLLRRFQALVDEVGRRRTLPDETTGRARQLIGELRTALAQVCLDTLEPDLVILDEFQRFRHLLDRQEGGEAAELAHQLFDYGQTRVLLLSATPYKPFTYAEEAADGDDHHRDFTRILRFLTEQGPEEAAGMVGSDLAAYREHVRRGEADKARDLAGRIRGQLLQVMCRTERPQLSEQVMLSEQVTEAGGVLPDDLRGYAALRRVAETVGARLPIDYWKSAPYFVNFLDGYQLGERIREHAAEPEVADLLADTQRIDREAVRRFQPVDHGNARLRQLADQTVDAGWWQLLWIPPSLPYLAPGGPYAEATGVTKRLVFSSWHATPTAVAALLSYEAERQIMAGKVENTPAARARLATRLTYRADHGRPATMTTLALFWPTPQLATMADPLAHARSRPDHPVPLAEFEQAVAAAVARHLPPGEGRGSGGDAWYTAHLASPGGSPEGLSREEIVAALTGGTPEGEEDRPDRHGLALHVDTVLAARASGQSPEAARPADLADTVASLAAHAPGNIAWRALHRLAAGRVSPQGHWQAAAALAAGLRTLFARPEVALLLEKLSPGIPYWRSVLRYCAWGNLQAALDEYLHHLALAEGITEVTGDADLDRIVAAARTALTLRPSAYQAWDPDRPDEPVTFPSRFALRFGGRRQDQPERQPHIRAAFNSPFWPFVLATTSVGQEGLDFHWWCHAVVHWNTPTNPVDFEQREGRVFRYSGHAVRRNLAARHGAQMLRSAGPDPWAAGYALAADRQGGLGAFAPRWIYPGAAQIERHVSPYPLSADLERYRRLKQDLTLYRLTLGQPRQEDMVEFLRRRDLDLPPERLAELRIDLQPPPFTTSDYQETDR